MNTSMTTVHLPHQRDPHEACPSWCDFPHDVPSPLHPGLHKRDVSHRVMIVKYDGERARINAYGRQDMTPGQARKLAAQLLVAAEQAERG